MADKEREYKIGERVFYDNVTSPGEYLTIDSEEQIDYGFGSDDAYYYVKEHTNLDTSRDGRKRIWKANITPLDKLSVCSICGGIDIEILAYINPNTNKVIRLTAVKVLCSTCGKHSLLCTREEFENQIKT